MLAENGPHGLKVRSIAEAAGCSTTGVYTWFGNKNGLIEAVWLDSFRRFGAELEALEWATFDSQLDALREGMYIYRSWAITNRERYLVMFAHAVPDFKPTDAASIEALGTFQILVDAVARCVAEGSLISDEPTELANHLWASTHGYVMLELSMRDAALALGDATYRRGLELLLSGIASS